ncbi:MAG: hypothetical protein HZA50_04905 [Planctomycetes bacterium]|nr:hypothetical protein [Planctomycetota bacterium]
MERQQIGLTLVMEQVGLPLEVKDFEHRLILEKTIYLVQASGVNLGYFFQWYLRGPYCPDVADDGFAACAELAAGNNESNNWKLDDNSAKNIQRLKDVIGDTSNTKALARNLELLASIHFLIDRKQVRGHNPQEILRIFHEYKKDFVEKEIEQGIKEMVENGILAK